MCLSFAVCSTQRIDSFILLHASVLRQPLISLLFCQQLGADTQENGNKWNNWWDELYNSTAGKIQAGSEHRGSISLDVHDDCSSTSDADSAISESATRVQSTVMPEGHHSSGKSSRTNGATPIDSEGCCAEQKNGIVTGRTCESNWRISCKKSNRQKGKLERIKVSWNE